MTRLAVRLAPVAMLALGMFALGMLAAGPARAGDCLRQIDDLTVEYDLAASEAMAGIKSAATAPQPGYQVPQNWGGYSQNPPGRPGLHSGSLGSVGGAPGAGLQNAGSPDLPMLPPRRPIPADQKQRLEAKLKEARGVEAMGNETQCLERLEEARNIAGKKG